MFRGPILLCLLNSVTEHVSATVGSKFLLRLQVGQPCCKWIRNKRNNTSQCADWLWTAAN
jgi:hypothetical protein